MTELLDQGTAAIAAAVRTGKTSARDVAEAGRELGRFDSRPWLGSVRVPIAVLITSRDEAVPVPKQRELAAAAGGPVLEAPIRHLEIVTRAAEIAPAAIITQHRDAHDTVRDRRSVQFGLRHGRQDGQGRDRRCCQTCMVAAVPTQFPTSRHMSI